MESSELGLTTKEPCNNQNSYLDYEFQAQYLVIKADPKYLQSLQVLKQSILSKDIELYLILCYSTRILLKSWSSWKWCKRKHSENHGTGKNSHSFFINLSQFISHRDICISLK